MTPRSGLGALLCLSLLVVPLVSLRNGEQDKTLSVTAGRPSVNRVLERPAETRASRSARRSAPASTTTSTEPPTTTTAAPVFTAASVAAPPTTAAPRPAPRPTTTRPRPATTTTAKPKPPPSTTTTRPQPSPPPNSSSGNSQSGKASWYQADYHQQSPQWCAHRSLPKGTVVHITNTANGRTASCTVMDRGPYVDGRILDLSQHTFSQLAPPDQGVIPVRITW